MNKTIFKYKGKTIGKLNYRKHSLQAIVKNLMEKGVYCQIDKICEYEFDTHVYLSIAKNTTQRVNILNIAEEFDTAIKTNRTKLPVYEIDSIVS